MSLYGQSYGRREGLVSEGGGLAVSTGALTGRSANDKFTVRDATTENTVWQDNNKAMPWANFDIPKQNFLAHSRLKNLFEQDILGGADPAYALPIRMICEFAWHALFIQHLLIVPKNRDGFSPMLTVISR